MQVGLESGKPMRKLSQWSILKDCENRNKRGLVKIDWIFSLVRYQSREESKNDFEVLNSQWLWKNAEEKKNGKEGDMERKDVGLGMVSGMWESNTNWLSSIGVMQSVWWWSLC